MCFWLIFFIGQYLCVYSLTLWSDAYTMFAIKQEKLGDEYDQRITDAPAAATGESNWF